LFGKNNKNDDIFYEELCNKYYEQIYYFCNRLVKGQAQFIDFVEDCTQNTFLEARKQISKLRKHPNIEGWLYTTARNLINNSYRSMYIKKKHELCIDDIASTPTYDIDKELEDLFYDYIDIDKLCAEILSKLNEKEYDLYIDHYKSSMPISELSKKYDISSTAMTTRIYRLKIKIKNIVHDYFKEK